MHATVMLKGGFLKLSKTITGQWNPADEESIKSLSKIPVGGVIEVKLIRDKVRQQRSTKQNAYYWAVVLETAVRSTDSSYDTEEFNYWFKCEIFGTKKIGDREVPKFSTRDLNTEQMEKYLTACRNIGETKLGIYISMPNESGYNY